MIAVVLPVYNECEGIEALLRDLRTVLSARDEPYRIVVVDDGSEDGTAEVLDREAGEADDLTVARHRVNLSIGAAFTSGLLAAAQHCGHDGDVIVLMEGDRTSSPEFLDRLVSECREGGADVAVASRYLPGGGYRRFPLFRLLCSRVVNRLLARSFPIPGVTDYTLFLRAYRAPVLRRVIDFFGPHALLASSGFTANAELLIKLSCFTPRITELPFLYDYGVKEGRSKLPVVRTICEYVTFFGYMRSLTRRLAVLLRESAQD